jgi:rRNA maturation protein Rpf1
MTGQLINTKEKQAQGNAETVEKLQMMHFYFLTSLKISHLQVWENHKMVDFRVFRQSRYKNEVKVGQM